MKRSSILAPGRNCWTADAPATACGLLVDGRLYYRAFYQAACAAERYILITGWKFTSDVRLLRGPDAQDAGDTTLIGVLKRLCQEKPGLEVYILAWNYSVIYSLEWEWYLADKFRAASERIHFCFDGEHTVGGSHHQKFVVVDGHTAFVGGLDFNGDDWDDRGHLPEDPERIDAGKPHGPYHDIQACLHGPAAAALADYFAMRWQRAGYAPLALPAPAGTPVVDPGLPVAATRVALSHNLPRTFTRTESVLEARALLLDAVAAAQELIYLENQYFTSDEFCQALQRRMLEADRPRLDIVLLLPKQLHGVYEAAALEPLRLSWMDALAATARRSGHRLGAYYSAAADKDGREVATLIHSKLLIVDDRFLTVGSTNVSNRSMGLDTELNVSWEACPPDDAALVASIRRIRVNLLAEHCGFLGREHELGDLEAMQGLVERLDALVGRSRLRCLTRQDILEDRAWLARLENWGFSMDPSHPVLEDLV